MIPHETESVHHFRAYELRNRVPVAPRELCRRAPGSRQRHCFGNVEGFAPSNMAIWGGSLNIKVSFMVLSYMGAELFGGPPP